MDFLLPGPGFFGLNGFLGFEPGFSGLNGFLGFLRIWIVGFFGLGLGFFRIWIRLVFQDLDFLVFSRIIVDRDVKMLKSSAPALHFSHSTSFLRRMVEYPR